MIMKLMIIIFVLSAFIFFKKINLGYSEIGTYKFWLRIKIISLFLMIGSFITIVIMI